MTATYTTQPGTLPHRAVEYFRAHPKAELSSAALAEAIDAPDANVAACLYKAVRFGLLHARKDGRLLMWSLGDGKPEPEEDSEADQALQRGEAPEPRPGPFLPGLTTLQPPTTPAPPVERQPFNAGLWVDGSLILVGLQLREDGAAVVSPEDTMKLRQLLAWAPPPAPREART